MGRHMCGNESMYGHAHLCGQAYTDVGKHMCEQVCTSMRTCSYTHSCLPDAGLVTRVAGCRLRALPVSSKYCLATEPPLHPLTISQGK